MNEYFSHDAERSVIGAFLQDSNTLKRLDEISVDDFHADEHRRIVAAMKELRAQKKSVDVLTVGETLAARQMLDQCGGAAYLLQAVRFCPSTVNIASHIDILTERRKRRELYSLAKMTMDMLNSGENANDAADALRGKLRNVATCADETISAAQLASVTFDDLERRSKGTDAVIRTGLPDLDQTMNGLFPRELILLGARPAVGKSALGMAMATHAAESGKRVLVVSREMGAEQYGQRLFSAMGDVTGDKLRAAKLDERDWAELSTAVNRVCELPMRFAFQTSSVESLRRLCKCEADLYGLDMLVVDYLQLMGTTRQNDNEAVRLGYISVALKEIAMEYAIPVLALAQVNRQEGRADVLPTLKELKGSGNLEQDADVVLFLHHPENDKDKAIPRCDVETFKALEERGEQYVVVKVAKQRQGRTGLFGLAFDPSHMTYMCIVR